MATATFRIWRGDASKAGFQDYKTEVSEGMVVLDVVHKIQAEQAKRPRPCAGTARPGKCVVVLGRNQRQGPAPDVHDPAQFPAHGSAGDSRADVHTFPLVKDLVTDVSWNFRVKEKITAPVPRNRMPRMEPGASSRPTWTGPQEFRKCIECFLCQDVCHVLRDHHMHAQVHRPAFHGVYLWP